MPFYKPEYLIVIGKNIRHARKTKGLSFRQMAIIADMDHSDLNRIELGRVNIGVLTLIKIAEALQVDPAELIRLQ